MNDDAQQPLAPHPAGNPPVPGRLPGRWVWAIVLLCATLIAVLWPLGLRDGRSRADLNVATVVLTLLAILTLVVWFLRNRSYSAPVRRTVGLGLLLSLGLSAAVLRVDDFSGDLIPRLALRWRAARDRQLQPPAPSGTPVDLTRVTPHDFPQFLGPRRDNSLPQVALETDWQTCPPRLRWKTEIGAGWSGFSVVNGYAVTMEQRGEEELVTCREVASGQIQWYHSVPARHESVLGGVGPRSTPTLDQGKVYALGATGVLRCLDGASGREIWRDDILQRLGLTPEADLQAISWGRSASPLIVDDLVVVPWGGPPGRRASLAAYDKDDGRLVWTGGEHQASYSSPCLATFSGVPQIVIVSEGFVTAHDPTSGDLLWETPWPGGSSSNASVSQPLALPGDRLLLSKGYGIKAKLLQIVRNPQGNWSVQESWERSRILQTKFTNLVVRDGFAYGLSDGILECVDVDTGRRQWRAGRYGQGQLLGVGDCLLIQAESGRVALAAAQPDGWQELGSFAALEGKTWNNPCLFQHFLLVRNAAWAACYELELRK